MTVLQTDHPPTRAVPVDALSPGMVLVGDDGGRATIRRVGGHAFLTGLVTVWTEYGPLLLDPDDYVAVQR